jgi:flagellar biosynthetic protein FlhB
LPGEEKTEKATPKKRSDQRKKGNVSTSKDVVSVVSMFIMFCVMRLMFPFIYSTIANFFTESLKNLSSINAITKDMLLELFVRYARIFVMCALPLLIVASFIGFIATGVQTKFLFAKESLKPKFEKLNPIQGIKRLFSLKNLVEVLKNIVKIIILGYFVYTFIKDNMDTFFKLQQMDVFQAGAVTLSKIFALVIKVSMAFAVIAFFDYLYQRWSYEKNIKMTKKEVKDEYKQQEGDPKVKGKIRNIQRQMAMSRMMQAVPDADVVIRNPTHYAIALKYNIEKDNAPMVVAMGQDNMALRIVAVAMANNVYVIENKELTRAMYPLVDINREIPIDFYNAIAEIFALMYTAKNEGEQ